MSNLTLIATYRVVTPMFLGGADPLQEAELRVPSFKGALRFWWRALMMWRGVREVQELHDHENELFGCSDSKIGQSKVLLRIETVHWPEMLKSGDILGEHGGKADITHKVVADGVRYLGYGLMEAFDGQKTEGGRLIRSCISAPSEFRLHVRFNPRATVEDCRQVLGALKLLGLCGCLGSRARRGFGSLTLTNLSGCDGSAWNPPCTISEWESNLNETLGTRTAFAGMAAWTGFVPGQSKVLLVQEAGKMPLEILGRLGRDFVFFRSWGRNGRVLGKESEKRFLGDHDLMKTQTAQRRGHPKRIVFGLPHNYGKSPDQHVEPGDPLFDRRASPLFFHIHQSSAMVPPIGVLLFLPSRFLPPEHDKISVGEHDVPLAHGGEGEFWKPVHDFLERLRSGSGKERFDEAHLIQL